MWRVTVTQGRSIMTYRRAMNGPRADMDRHSYGESACGYQLGPRQWPPATLVMAQQKLESVYLCIAFVGATFRSCRDEVNEPEATRAASFIAKARGPAITLTGAAVALAR
jgi:hypothetical protein